MGAHRSNPGQAGFTVVELIVAIVVFGILVTGLVSAYKSLRSAYTLARQFNEAYTVLSACPEVDRALEFNSLGSATNCYPNNSFPAEDGGPGTITYSPQLTVTPTTSLTASDPLQTIPDSKVVNIQVKLPKPNNNTPTLQLRMLITRNGIGQL
jgi:prepilin-type N-terminal cleavage/methylation domain-containing protein